MLAKRLATILPDLTFEESLEITKIHSISGKLDSKNPIVIKRPFRSPHHTISEIALIGGGKVPIPGEISLAHFGVLYLDELPEFNKHTLEVLRGPIEDEKVTISRLNASITYPSKFMLVASMNPCKCGYYGSDIKECSCTKNEITKYMSKISGPLLDRIDLQIEVQNIKYKKIEESSKENSNQIKVRVNNARLIQLKRYKNDNIFSNSQLTPIMINKYCQIDEQSKKLLGNG